VIPEKGLNGLLSRNRRPFAEVIDDFSFGHTLAGRPIEVSRMNSIVAAPDPV
jgi:hypothetical protein